MNNQKIAISVLSAVLMGFAAVAIAAPAVYVREGNTTGTTGSDAIGATSTNSRNDTVSVGAPGAERQIINLSPGTAGTDAVNVDQLNNVEHKMAAGIAASMAMTPPIIAPGKTSAIAVGTGYYDGSNAIAVSIAHLIKKDVYVNAAVSYGGNGGNGTNLGNNSNVGARASVSYSF